MRSCFLIFYTIMISLYQTMPPNPKSSITAGSQCKLIYFLVSSQCVYVCGGHWESNIECLFTLLHSHSPFMFYLLSCPCWVQTSNLPASASHHVLYSLIFHLDVGLQKCPLLGGGVLLDRSWIFLMCLCNRNPRRLRSLWNSFIIQLFSSLDSVSKWKQISRLIIMCLFTQQNLCNIIT